MKSGTYEKCYHNLTVNKLKCRQSKYTNNETTKIVSSSGIYKSI